jgi:hypothetical protein
MNEIKVYIASPYSNGDIATNVKFQMEVADKLMDLGFFPFVPLYSHFQHMFNPRTHTDWIRIDLVWLRQCDCIIRFYTSYNGKVLESTGADIEEDEAKRIGIPVFHSIEELVEYYKEKKED